MAALPAGGFSFFLILTLYCIGYNITIFGYDQDIFSCARTSAVSPAGGIILRATTGLYDKPASYFRLGAFALLEFFNIHMVKEFSL